MALQSMDDEINRVTLLNWVHFWLYCRRLRNV